MVLLYHMFHLFMLWPELPDRVAIHFSNGEADGWGTKYNLFLLPILAVLWWAGANFFVKRPEKLNLPNTTEENREAMLFKGKKIMAIIQNAITMMFLFLNEEAAQNAAGHQSQILMGFVIFLLLISFIAAPFLLLWPREK